jgi:hypothetical protein
MPESCRAGVLTAVISSAFVIRGRHDSDVGESGRLDDAAFDEPAEVDDERVALKMVGPVLHGLPRLQGDDAAFGECRFEDVGGAVVKIIGDQNAAEIA